MRFVNIAGRISAMDDFIISTIVPFDIQLENAMYILDSVKGLYPFSEDNPYERLNQKVADLMSVLDRDLKYDPSLRSDEMQVAMAEPVIDGYERQMETIRNISSSLKEDLAHKKEIRKQIAPIKNLEVNVDRMFNFKFMKFRFGKMPKDSYEKLNDYIGEMNTIAYKVSEEGDNVYLLYFTPRSQQGNIDSLFASLFFERIRISEDVKGLPGVALKRLDDEIEDLEGRINMLDEDSRGFVERNLEQLEMLYSFTIELNEVFEVRRYAVRSKDAFYLTGWIPESQEKEFMEMVDRQEGITCIVEDDSVVKKSSPPTKLSNIKFIEPFEELVRMYGVPSYNELDPTPFVAITYVLFFGLMFGDVGQGLVIALLGYLLYRKTKHNLSKLAIYLGFISAVTGVFYGSIFGNEELLRELLPFIPMINPMEYKLPILLAAVAFGVFLLLLAMLLNIINSYKREQLGKMLFDRNGIAGMVFYLAVLYVILSNVQGAEVSQLVIIFLIIVPLFLIFLAHPLENLLERKAHVFPKEGGFFIEAIFELIETLLAFLSNTISFIRIAPLPSITWDSSLLSIRWRIL